jgi:riboflavin synthase
VFTGLVEAIGRLESRVPVGVGARLRISTNLGPLVLGESIAVMGACLTVDAILAGGFEADASAETLAKTTLGRLPVGCPVHLERAMPVGGRLGGHIVSGHVDGVTRLVERRALGQAMDLAFSLDGSLARFVAQKGSVAIDGVSLTVNSVEPGRFHVVIVPHTQQATSLSLLAVGDWCNLEVDVLARYVARWLEVGRATEEKASDDTMLAKLASSGYL